MSELNPRINTLTPPRIPISKTGRSSRRTQSEGQKITQDRYVNIGKDKRRWLAQSGSGNKLNLNNPHELQRIIRELKGLDLPFLMTRRKFQNVKVLNEIIRNRKELNPRNDNRPVLLVFYPKTDWNGGFDSPAALKQWVVNEYRVVYYEVGNVQEFIKSFKEATQIKKALAIVIGGHGTSRSIQLGKENYIYLTDFEKIQTENFHLRLRLERKPRIILESCSNGSGGRTYDNMANMFAKLFPQAQIHSPKKDLVLGLVRCNESPHCLTLDIKQKDKYIAYPFTQNSRHVEVRYFHPNGRAKEIFLKDKMEIDGTRYQRGYVKFDSRDRVIHFKPHLYGRYKSRFKQISLKISDAKRKFLISGDFELAKNELNAAIKSLDEMQNPPQPEDSPLKSEELNIQNLFALAYQTLGWLNLQAFNRPESEGFFSKAENIYKQIISKVENKTYDTKALSEAGITLGQIHFNMAELLKAKCEMNLSVLNSAMEFYNKSIKINESEINDQNRNQIQISILIAKIAKIELLIMKAKIIEWSGDFETASGEIKEDKVKELRGIINELKLLKAKPTALFDAHMTLAKLYMMKGRIEERKGLGTGANSFLEASKVYTELMEDAILGESAFLLSIGKTGTDLILERAKALEAGGIKNKENLTRAIADYDRVTSDFKRMINNNEHPQIYTAKISLLKALCGMANSKLNLGRILEEDGWKTGDVQKNYEESIRIVNDVFGQLKSICCASFDKSVLLLRLSSVLTSALTQLGRLKIGKDFSDKYRKEAGSVTAQLLFEAFVKGTKPNNYNSELKSMYNLAKSSNLFPNLDGILEALSSTPIDRSAPTKDILLFISGIDVASIYLDYYKNQLLVKSLGLEFIGRNFKPKLGPRESEFLSKAHLITGNWFLSRGREDEAKPSYNAVLIQIAGFIAQKSRVQPPKDVDGAIKLIEGKGGAILGAPYARTFFETYLRVVNGRGLRYAYIGKYKKAIDEYNKIVNLLSPKVKTHLRDSTLVNILENALIKIGDIYNHNLHKIPLAEKFYNQVGRDGREIWSSNRNALASLHLAQSRLGRGECEFKKGKYKNALGYFEAGLGLLKSIGHADHETKQALIQLYTAKARVLNKVGKVKEGVDLLQDAKKLYASIEEDYHPSNIITNGRMLDAMSEMGELPNFSININPLSFASEVFLNKIHSGVYRSGGRKIESSGFVTSAAVDVHGPLQLHFGYSRGIARKTNYQTTGSESIPRLELDAPNTFEVSAGSGVNDGYSWNWNFRVLMKMAFASYRLNEYMWNEDLTRWNNKGTPKDVLWTGGGPFLFANLRYKHRFNETSSLAVGGALKCGYFLSSSPFVSARKADLGEFVGYAKGYWAKDAGQGLDVQKEKEKYLDASLSFMPPPLSLNSEIFAKYQHKFILDRTLIGLNIFSGWRFGHYPEEVTSYGVFPAFDKEQGDIGLWRIGLLIGIDTAVRFGKILNWNFTPLSLKLFVGTPLFQEGAKFGDLFNISARTGVKYKHNNFGFGLYSGITYSNDGRLENTQVNLLDMTFYM